MSLEDVHTKALRLVKEADYPEGDTQNRALRDTIISSLASDKICAKVIKEGKDVTLARVMEITRLEVSTEQHIDRMQETVKINYVQYGKGSQKKKEEEGQIWTQWQCSSWQQQQWQQYYQWWKTLQFERKWKEPPPTTYWHLLEMWKISTSERSTMQNNGSSLQKLWNQRTLWEGVYEEVNPLGRSSKQFQWFWSRLLQWIWWTCLCSETSSSCKVDTQKETSHPVSNMCQLRESEEAGRRPLSYCSAEGWHRSWCQSSKLHYIWQNNRQQIDPTAINLQNGSVWKFHCRCIWDVLHIP